MQRKRWGYVRVSSKEQNVDRQLDALRPYVEEDRDIIIDRQSGKDFARDGYQLLRTALLREGDELIVKSIDRLGRNKEAIRDELQYYRQAGIRVKIIDLPTTMLDWPQGQELVGEMVNSILIEVFSMIAEQERVNIRTRQAEGIAAAHARGKHLGRPRIERPERWAEVYAAWRAGQITAVRASEVLGMKRATFYKKVKELEGDGA